MNEALFSVMCFACNAFTAKDTQIQLLSFNTKILLKQFNKKFNPINNNSID